MRPQQLSQIQPVNTFSFIEEAKERWHMPTPPFFIKTGKFGAAMVGFGTTLTGISIGCKWLTWIIVVGGVIAGLGTGIVGISNFVIQSGILLQPGESVVNDTPKQVQVTPG